MVDLDNEENIKKTIQDTQMLIRNHMQHHKKISKQLHSQIKKDKKTIELFKEKISKLVLEKEKLDLRQRAKNEKEGYDTPDIEKIKQEIINHMTAKKDIDDKIKERQANLLMIKNEMGGLNATQQLQERYEKHIKILENRLDKANQKFNESIEYDKKLRAEIDKLRKERFFFENIYKRLEKELEKVRKEISTNLEETYKNYEARDKNQEEFENLKAQMIKKESDYTNMISEIANEQNILYNRKKSMERKELKNLKNEENINSNAKNYAKKLKNEQYEQQQENLREKYQNLKYKFEKLIEFTDKSNVKEFCEKFKKNSQKNYELFQSISMLSSDAKKIESEIKEMEEEIEGLQKFKNSQQGIERQNKISDLKTKTQKLTQKRDEYENDYKKQNNEFRQIKNSILMLFNTLKCGEILSEEESLEMKVGVNENNALEFLSKIEKQLKSAQKILEYSHNLNAEEDNQGLIEPNRLKSREINENMKAAFTSMDISKIKAMEKIKSDHKADDFKLESVMQYSKEVVQEVLDNINRSNANERKQQNKFKKMAKY